MHNKPQIYQRILRTFYLKYRNKFKNYHMLNCISIGSASQFWAQVDGLIHNNILFV
jgi:hypothetical protein